ncbi:ATP-binding cassette domain-containing protein [Vibrio sp. PP-XX7]
MNQQSLTIDHLSVTCHDRTLVNQLSICVHQGRTLALIGASGSGKSLSLAAILDLLPNGLSQTYGGIYLNQQPIESHGLRGRVVASIMQNPRSGFNPVRTIKQHAKETLKAIGYTGSAKTPGCTHC